jgi:hypothetical protein
MLLASLKDNEELNINILKKDQIINQLKMSFPDKSEIPVADNTNLIPNSEIETLKANNLILESKILNLNRDIEQERTKLLILNSDYNLLKETHDNMVVGTYSVQFLSLTNIASFFNLLIKSYPQSKKLEIKYKNNEQFRTTLGRQNFLTELKSLYSYVLFNISSIAVTSSLDNINLELDEGDFIREFFNVTFAFFLAINQRFGIWK